MLKKIKSALVFTLALIMVFSMTAFAAETGSGNTLTISLDKVEYSYDGIMTRGPAPAVSSVKVENAYLDSNGNVIVVVYIMGYGRYENAKWDGNSVALIKEELISGTDRVVYAFRQYYNCGPATIGSHTFTFSTTSINPPRNTVSTTATFKVS